MPEDLEYRNAPPIDISSVTKHFLSVALFPFLLTLLSAIACYGSTGPSLGLYIAGLVLATLLLPAFSMAEQTILDRLIAATAVVVPISAVWLFGKFHSETYLREWGKSTLVLEAYAIALVGLAAGLRWAKFPAIAAAALSVFIGLAWLTWPIWLSRTWDGESSAAGVARLVMFHPGMAINGQVATLGAWSEQSVAYHLTDLSQNVLYSLPTSIWPTVLFHTLFGGGLLCLASWVAGRGVAVKTWPSIVQIDPSATKNSAT